MLFDEVSTKQEFEVEQLAAPGTIMHPVLLSHITDNDLAWKPVSFLSRLVEEAKKVESEQLHRVRVSVVGLKLPSKSSDAIKDCVRVYDTKT